MVGVEIVQSKSTRQTDSAKRNMLVDACFERGLLLLGCGENTIRFSPPLIVTDADVDTAMTLFENVLTDLG
jgi:4-aminobutyrate aminotransferase